MLICDRTKYGGGILKVAMWVDDLLVTTTSKADKEWFDGLMRDLLTSLKIQELNQPDYISV